MLFIPSMFDSLDLSFSYNYTIISTGSPLLCHRNIMDLAIGLVWESIGDLYFEKETMLFSIFYLNPMASQEEKINQLQCVQRELNYELQPYIEHYVWTENPVYFKLAFLNGYNYICGELVYGDGLQDEWLVTQILFEISKRHPDLYIHVSDNEGEFLLIEAASKLPEWLNPVTGTNRDWINHGRLLIIPEIYYQERGLKLDESLKFLEKAVYKCSKIIEVDEAIIRKLDNYPKCALESQIYITLRVPRKLCSMLMKKSLLSRAIISSAKKIAEYSAKIEPVGDLVDMNIRSTVFSYMLLKFLLKSEHLEDSLVERGKIIQKVVGTYTEENKPKFEPYDPTDDDILRFNSQGDLLQEELISRNIIEDYIPPDLEIGEYPKSLQDDLEGDFKNEELMSRLDMFFRDTKAGLDGVENSDSNSDVKRADDSGDDESDDDHEDEEDRKARQYLKSENVDIDEDDFFEFFAKEALKLSNEELENLRNIEVENDKIRDTKIDLDENSDDAFDSHDAHSIDLREMREAIRNLLKSVRSEGGATGPGATFLQSLGIIPPEPK